MNMSNKNKIEEAIKRIQLLGLDADIKTDDGNVRHFHHGHEYVEIGGMKWATMNVGAKSVYDGGLYFQWGDTKGWSAEQIRNGEKLFLWETYKHCILQERIKFNKYSAIDNKKVLELEDDAVYAYLGGNWRMPTVDEFDSLKNTTTNAWVIDYEGSSIKGAALTSKEDSSIKLFFPAVGYASTNYVISKYINSLYWANSIGGNYGYACNFLIREGKISTNSNSRCFGFLCRGVVG